MPGSVTIGHFHPSVTLGHDDAERLTGMLARLSTMLEARGPERITDEQMSVLFGADPEQRAECTEWARRLTRHLDAHL